MLVPLFFIDPAKNVGIDLLPNQQEKLSILEQIAKALTVSDFAELFSKNHMLALIVFSLLFGISLRTVDKENKLAKTLEMLSSVMLKIVKIVMYYAPIGLCAYFAALVGEYGKEIIGSYAKSMIFYIIMAMLYYFIFYTVYSYLENQVNEFVKKLKLK